MIAPLGVKCLPGSQVTAAVALITRLHAACVCDELRGAATFDASLRRLHHVERGVGP